MCTVELAVDDKDAYRSSRGGMCALWVLVSWVVCVHCGAG